MERRSATPYETPRILPVPPQGNPDRPGRPSARRPDRTLDTRARHLQPGRDLRAPARADGSAALHACPAAARTHRPIERAACRSVPG